MMTEEEAKKRQCCGPPLVAMMSLVAAAIPEKDLDGLQKVVSDNVSCLGARCMAWRWHWKRGEPPLNQESLGYCGIAGRPE